jgi:poly(A) polymerase
MSVTFRLRQCQASGGWAREQAAAVAAFAPLRSASRRGLDICVEVDTMEYGVAINLGIGIDHLLLRYGTSNEGKIVKKAHIYTRAEHGIEVSRVDPDAVWIVKRLRGEGFHAYVVGGAVRDLLVGRSPKDFDIATDALPQRIRRIFRSARLIGRRFRIVHVYIGREKYIEVTTFRSNKGPEANNFFGTMEEDAQRRDFTVNALYYCPADQQLIDYVDGLTDIRQKRLKTLIPAETSFTEDPVRMIRAVKYASLTQFPIPHGMAALIRRMCQSLLTCSRERVTEEVYKILISGAASQILEQSYRLKMFEVLFPSLFAFIDVTHRKFTDSRLYQRAVALDAENREGRGLARDRMFSFLFHDLALAQTPLFDDPEPLLILQQFIRSASTPLFPSKRDLGVASHEIMREFQRLTGRHFHRAAQKSGGRPGGGSRRPAKGHRMRTRNR